MAEQYDFVWHGPYRVERDMSWSPEQRLQEILAREEGSKRGLYMIMGQKGWRRWTRRPLYIGATMRSFGARLLEHLGKKMTASQLDESLETGRDSPTILAAESKGWRITSIWLGELRSDSLERVHQLVHAERSLIYFFEPKLNKMLTEKPASECTIINRKDMTLWSKSDVFEWHPDQLPSIIDMRVTDDGRAVGEALWGKSARSSTVKRRYLIKKGALRRRDFRPGPPKSSFGKPPMLG